MAVEDIKRQQQGRESLKKMGWDARYGNKSNPDYLGDTFWDFTLENCFGNVWARPGLSVRDRELVTLGVLIAADNDGIMPHLRHSASLGITEEMMWEIIFQALTYAGWPRGSAAAKRFNAILAEPDNGYRNKPKKA